MTASTWSRLACVRSLTTSSTNQVLKHKDDTKPVRGCSAKSTLNPEENNNPTFQRGFYGNV
jgi:hypothetical protein